MKTELEKRAEAWAFVHLDEIEQGTIPRRVVSESGEILPERILEEAPKVFHRMKAAYFCGYQDGVRALLTGVEREKQYHEFLDEKGEMRHPILACKEIISYGRALLGPKKEGE